MKKVFDNLIYFDKDSIYIESNLDNIKINDMLFYILIEDMITKYFNIEYFLFIEDRLVDYKYIYNFFQELLKKIDNVFVVDNITGDVYSFICDNTFLDNLTKTYGF